MSGLDIEKTDYANTRHIDVPSIDARFQTRLYDGMQDIMCGQRGKTSFIDATYAQAKSGSFECPAGLTACSDGAQAVNGFTLCVDLTSGD